MSVTTRIDTHIEPGFSPVAEFVVDLYNRIIHRGWITNDSLWILTQIPECFDCGFHSVLVYKFFDLQRKTTMQVYPNIYFSVWSVLCKCHLTTESNTNTALLLWVTTAVNAQTQISQFLTEVVKFEILN